MQLTGSGGFCQYIKMYYMFLVFNRIDVAYLETEINIIGIFKIAELKFNPSGARSTILR